MLSQVPDGHLNFTDDGDGGRDMQLYLTGDDPALVERTAHQVIAEMRGLERDARSAHHAAICRGRRSWCTRGSISPRNSA